MATAAERVEVEPGHEVEHAPNGAAMAAFLGGGIGAFAMGMLVVLNEAGLFSAPSLYGPAGGVSGRTTFAAAVWLLGWGILHRRWRGREVGTRSVFGVALVLTAIGLLATFPPLWGLL